MPVRTAVWFKLWLREVPAAGACVQPRTPHPPLSFRAEVEKLPGAIIDTCTQFPNPACQRLFKELKQGGPRCVAVAEEPTAKRRKPDRVRHGEWSIPLPAGQ